MADELDNMGNDHLDYEESVNDTDENGAAAEDAELLAMRERIREMEEESERLQQLQREINRQLNIDEPLGLDTPDMSLADKIEVDSRSVYVGNVDYDASAAELEQHFYDCGPINRVNIGCNKYDGQPKGFAYIEFAEIDSVQNAMTLDESVFKGRILKVMHKRTNRPGISTTNRRPRGRPFLRGSRGRARGYYPGYYGEPRYRPRGYNNRYYSPY